MAQDFVRPNNPGLTKIVEESLDGTYGSYDAMRDGLKAALGIKTTVDPTREDFGYGADPTAPQFAPQIAASGAQPTCVRVLYPGGNDRFEITGMSEAELDLKESALRAMYQS
jgi:hypothetical protein